MSTKLFLALLKTELLYGIPKGDAAARTAVAIYLLVGVLAGALLV